MSADDTPPRVWFADGLLFVEHAHLPDSARPGYDVVQIRPYVYAGGIEPALPDGAVELRPAVPAVPDTAEPLCGECQPHARGTATPAELVENCGAGHDPAQISCEAATEIVRLRRAVEMANRSLDRAWEAIPEGLSAEDDSLASHIRTALASGGTEPAGEVEQLNWERDMALSRVAAAEAVQVRMADSLPDSGPVDSWSERDRAVRDYEGELSAALAAES